MTSDWQWDETLDAVAAAPAQHRLVFEDAHVRVLDTRIEPGERTPVHTHRWPAAHYVVSWSDFVRRDAENRVLLDTRTALNRTVPEALWGEALPPHSLENVGAVPLHIISTELKRASTGAVDESPLSSERFSLLPGLYAVVRLAPTDRLPEWLAETPEGIVSVTRTADELSVVCQEFGVPSHCRVERDWRVLKLHGPYPFEQVGVLVSFTSPLAAEGVSIFAVSTFDTDYVLVKQEQLERALSALQRAGQVFVPQ